MPFVQRVIEPKYLSRINLHDENGAPLITDCELEAIANNTLCNALRQLASLVVIANDIFVDLTKQLEDVTDRSKTLKVKIEQVGERLSHFDPKKVTVPESDISTFAALKQHYASQQVQTTGLFSAATRPDAVRALYAAAAKTPVHAMRTLDRWHRDGRRSSGFFLCTPVLGARRRKFAAKVDIEIETRMPAAVEELRRWTSDEALGDVTVPPDCLSRIPPITPASDVDITDAADVAATSGDEGVDHKLPSPEEQLQAVALKFPAEIVAVDISGRSFDRLSAQRRSLLHIGSSVRNRSTGNEPKTEGTIERDSDTVRRRSRTRKPRAKRRNTITGTDQREIEQAVSAGDQPSTSRDPDSPDNGAVIRSKSSDLLESKKSPSDGKKSHFNTLKQWGKNRLKMINKSFESKSNSNEFSTKIDDIDDINIYETVTVRRKKTVDKDRKFGHERNFSCSSSEKSSINLPISTPMTGAMNMAVKLRESAAQRRQRRTSGGNKDDPPHSSSGNWSASSESGRASIGSEITSSTAQPKSTTSCATSSNSLNTHSNLPSSVTSRRRVINTSTSGSVTSEGTLTPDIIHDLHDDGETSSVYSCDTEGYYTSFHMDSGLKPLKEEELTLPSTPLQSTTVFSNSSSNNTIISAENEYELFGKGSTSTTTSSAGTVCTTLMAGGSQRSLVIGPAVPERKSSLSKLEKSDSNSRSNLTKKNNSPSNRATVVAMVHKQNNGDESPDSGHNTSSSPIESISSPNGQRSCSEFEFSESSDLEGHDRIERIRLKTTINSSRIPSMCVITPPHSDDESVKSIQQYELAKKTAHKQQTPSEHSTESEQDDCKLAVKNLKRDQPKKKPPLETDLDAVLGCKRSPKVQTKNTENQTVMASATGTKKTQLGNINSISGYATIETIDKSSSPEKIDKREDVVKEPTNSRVSPNQPIFKATLQPLNNMFGKLKSNLTQLANRKEIIKASPKESANDSALYDAGEYVTIADVRNNNQKSSTGVYYANDVVKRNLATILSGQNNTEYVSLNELPSSAATTDVQQDYNSADSLERKRRQGARVTLDAEGKVIYSSDSLKRRKGAHTTFEPGPFVKDSLTPTPSPLPTHRTPQTIRPVSGSQDNRRPLSPQLGKVVIRANANPSQGVTASTAEFVRMPPTTVVTPNSRPMSPKTTNSRGAYVNVQDSVTSKVISPANEEGSAHLEFDNCSLDYNKSATVPTVNLNEQQYYNYQNRFGNSDRSNLMYRTLPSRKPPGVLKEEAPRSVTPDITRGLSTSSHPLRTQYYNTIGYKDYKLQPKYEDYRNQSNYAYPPAQYSPQKVNPQMMSPSDISILQMYEHTYVNPQQQTIKQTSQFNPETRFLDYDLSQKRSQNMFQPIPMPLMQSHSYARSRNQFLSSTPTKDTKPVVSKVPMGISNFFSPIHSQFKNEPTNQEKSLDNSLKISPIDPRNMGTFQASTPSKTNTLNAVVNLSNKLMSPKKSTMSHEELYAVIHKSKKKYNIGDDTGRASPAISEPGFCAKSPEFVSHGVKQPETGSLALGSRERHSWSPNSKETTKITGSLDRNQIPKEISSKQNWTSADRKLPSQQTSTLDFKRLLLQHGSKSNILPNTGNKISAVEQLKLSKPLQQPSNSPMHILNLSSSPKNLANRKFGPHPSSPRHGSEKQRVAPKLIMSPRSAWRFNSPRSDVLSSTILEDCREDESPNSSLEKDKQKIGVQSDIAVSNKQINEQYRNKSSARRQLPMPDSPIKKTDALNVNRSPGSMTGITRAQFIQAQKAQFFMSGDNDVRSNDIKSETNKKCPSPPTLETAL